MQYSVYGHAFSCAELAFRHAMETHFGKQRQRKEVGYFHSSNPAKKECVRHSKAYHLPGIPCWRHLTSSRASRKVFKATHPFSGPFDDFAYRPAESSLPLFHPTSVRWPHLRNPLFTSSTLLGMPFSLSKTFTTRIHFYGTATEI